MKCRFGETPACEPHGHSCSCYPDRWKTERRYGGKLVENRTQAISAQLAVYEMAAGLKPVVFLEGAAFTVAFETTNALGGEPGVLYYEFVERPGELFKASRCSTLSDSKTTDT